MDYIANSAKPAKIVFALQVVGHPRDSKRIAMLLENGFLVEAAAFQRDYHKGRPPECAVKSLGKIKHGKYFRRLFVMLQSIPKIRSAISVNDAVYASGPDMALLAIVAGLGLCKPVVLEIGDIQRIQISKSFIGMMMRFLDRFVAKRCVLLVATTPDFVDGYYSKRLGVKTPALIVENKLEKPVDDNRPANQVSSTIPATSTKLRIGYFGVLRCGWTWSMLEQLASTHPDKFEIVVAGIPMNPSDLDEKVSGSRNMKYLGKYRSPDDLESLYAQVDIVWTVFPNPNEPDRDWYWAQSICRSNRFYECCYHRTPIITLMGNGDCPYVQEYDIGITLEKFDYEGISQKLSSITSLDLARWRYNLSNLPENVYLYTDEARNLGDAIRSHIRIT